VNQLYRGKAIGEHQSRSVGDELEQSDREIEQMGAGYPRERVGAEET
jgi:hypothetical protein